MKPWGLGLSSLTHTPTNAYLIASNSVIRLQLTGFGYGFFTVPDA